jgi:phosphate/sulfate permease
MKPNRFLSYEWDAIAGILAAAMAIVLHMLHIVDEQIILPIMLALMALLFINFMRHTRSNEHTAEQVVQIQKMLAKVKSSLAVPDVVLIGPRQLHAENEHFTHNMRGEAIFFNVCLSMYRTQPLFNALLRPAIENPQVTSIQFVLDESQKELWEAEVLPKVTACNGASKVQEPRWCALDKNLSFILADTQPDGSAEALLSFWGEPFMSQSTERNVPRYIFHVQSHSELLPQLVEMERNCRMST